MIKKQSKQIDKLSGTLAFFPNNLVAVNSPKVREEEKMHLLCLREKGRKASCSRFDYDKCIRTIIISITHYAVKSFVGKSATTQSYNSAYSTHIYRLKMQVIFNSSTCLFKV